MLVTVELDLFEDATAKRPGSAAEVVELQSGDPCEQAVEHPAPEPLEGAAGTRPAPSDCKVVHAEGVDEHGDVRAFDLVVGGKGDDGLARGMLESCHDRSGFAELAGESDHGEPSSVRKELCQAFRECVARSIEHEDQFIGLPERVEAGRVVRIKFGGSGMATADRHDDRQFDFLTPFSHGRETPAECPAGVATPDPACEAREVLFTDVARA